MWTNPELATLDRAVGTWSRDDAKFAQRYHVTIAEDGKTMEGEGTMKQAGAAWEPDLRLSYVRASE